jgi:hypothetical protein
MACCRDSFTFFTPPYPKAEIEPLSEMVCISIVPQTMDSVQYNTHIINSHGCEEPQILYSETIIHVRHLVGLLGRGMSQGNTGQRNIQTGCEWDSNPRPFFKKCSTNLGVYCRSFFLLMSAPVSCSCRDDCHSTSSQLATSLSPRCFGSSITVIVRLH